MARTTSHARLNSEYVVNYLILCGAPPAKWRKSNCMIPSAFLIETTRTHSQDMAIACATTASSSLDHIELKSLPGYQSLLFSYKTRGCANHNQPRAVGGVQSAELSHS